MFNLQKHYVASGSYYVSTGQPMILYTMLGTCVGVAIYDSDANVGGLIHLLLPEPILKETSYMPEKYASNGLPVFIKALCEAGASQQRMQACIAGGSLICPLSQQDINLDIGGRTADVAVKILNNEGIKIEKSETGGFFGRSFSLNVQNWDSIIEPSGFDTRIDNDIAIPSPKEVINSIDHIQPVPQVALKILRMMTDGDDCDFAAVSNEIQKDQVISARTLQLCNSAMFSRSKKIDSLDHALVFLGKDLLLKLIVLAAVKKFFNQCDQGNMGYSLCKGGIFHHAVGTAIIAEKLASFTGKAPASLAYTAGLLHDIGKVVLDQYIASAYPLFYRGIQEEGKNMLEIETKNFGIDHTEVGKKLADKWLFPEVLADTIKHHHDPENAVYDIELAHIIHLADLLMSLFHPGLEMERISTDALSARLKKIDLSVSRLPEIVEFIPDQIFSKLVENNNATD